MRRLADPVPFLRHLRYHLGTFDAVLQAFTSKWEAALKIKGIILPFPYWMQGGLSPKSSYCSNFSHNFSDLSFQSFHFHFDFEIILFYFSLEIGFVLLLSLRQNSNSLTLFQHAQFYQKPNHSSYFEVN